MDGMGLGLLGVIATREEAHSARPGAPVRLDGHEPRRAQRGSRRIRAARARAGLSAALHRLADTITPEPEGSRSVR